MSKRGFHFAAISKAVFTHKEGDLMSKAEEVFVRLETSPNLNKAQYIDSDGMLTAEGLKACTIALVMGLGANIRLGEQQGWWTKEDQIAYIKEMLDESSKAAEAAKVERSTMEY